ncbi:unnamed protein product [Caenorhabditis brenneri]
MDSCAITSHWEHYPKARAVVFHSRDIDQNSLKSFPFVRRQDVPYIMMASESPYYAHMAEYKNYFNWTMTYRKDSDVFGPYGGLVKNNQTATINYTSIWKSKTKDVLWLVSNNIHVNNRRKEVVDKLKELGMNIDLYGQVYHNEPANCPRYGAMEECEEKLQKPYKFTIAFENSNCKDYVTEKFWNKAGRYQMVPIVMERKIYRDLGIPDEIYVSIDDFPSLKEFVEYINRTAADEEKYMKFHRWREEFRIVSANEHEFGFCQLCQKLIDAKDKPTPRKSYENLATWHSQLNCDNSFANKYL